MSEKKFWADRFEAERGRLRSVALRMLGSHAEAEDAVQEAWFRLERAEGGMKMKELSRRMMVTSGNITGITDQLVAEGLVERMDVEGDRRAYLVRLTPQGREQFNTMARQHEQWIVEAFATLGERDIATLYRLLGKVKEHTQNNESVS